MSYLGQAWLVLAGVLDESEAQRCLKTVLADPEAVKILLDRGADPDAKYQQTAETVREHIKKQYQSKIEQNRLSDAERQILVQLGIL